MKMPKKEILREKKMLIMNIMKYLTIENIFQLKILAMRGSCQPTKKANSFRN